MTKKQLLPPAQELPATCSGATLGDVLGISEKWVRALVTELGLPPARQGRFKTADTLRGICGHWRSNAKATDLESAKIAKLEIETQLLEMRQAEESRDLVQRNKVVEIVQRGLQAMQQTVLAITRLEPQERDDIILKLREAGELVADSFSKKSNENQIPNPKEKRKSASSSNQRPKPVDCRSKPNL